MRVGLKGVGAAGLLAIGASAVIWTGCQRANGQPAAAVEAAIAVRVVEATTDSFGAALEAPGVLGPREELQLSFKIGGVVARVLVREGDRVRAGQPLAVLDASEIDAAVARAKSALDKAERDHARARNLYADSVATLEQVQNAATGVEVARSDYETARFNQRYAAIAAPQNGVILRQSAEAGELVAPGVPVLFLGNLASGVVVRAGFADRDAVRIRAGDRAEAAFDAFPGMTFVGRVSQVGAAANMQTGTYAIEVALTNAPAQVSGLVGRVKVFPATRGQTLMVPIDAITEADGDSAVVFTLAADNTVQRRRVTLGQISGERVAITAGLDSGARVITAGAPYLTDGAKVKVIS